MAWRQRSHAFGFVTIDDLARGRVAQADIARDLPLVELALVRPDHLAAALVLFCRTEPAGVFIVHALLDNTRQR